MDRTGTNGTALSLDDSSLIFEGYKWMMSMRLFADREKKRLNIYNERLLACLAYAAHSTLDKAGLAGRVLLKDSDRFLGYKEVSVDIKAILGEGDSSNYSYVIRSVASLQSAVMFVPNGDDVRLRSIIVEADVLKGQSRIKFSVSPEVWNAVLDYGSGYRVTEYWVARALSSPLAYRIYKFVCGQERRFRMKVSDFVDTFGLPEMYKTRIYMLRTKILEPAKKELDEISPWSFTFGFVESAEAVRSPHRGKKTKDVLVINPVHWIKNERSMRHILGNVSGYGVETLLDGRVLKRLRDRYGFTDKELNNNSELLLKAGEVLGDGLYDFLLDRTEKFDSAEVKNRKGYILESIRNRLVQPC